MTIREIETIVHQPHHPTTKLVFIRIHTDDGLVGHGESYYVPGAVEAFIHDYAAPFLLGTDESRIERTWRTLYDLAARFGARGAEMRAISAIDVALWDIAGLKAAQPVYQLLGGATIDRLPVYNTCGGPTYGTGTGGREGRSPYTDTTTPPDPRDDLWFAMYDAGTLAQSLLDDGFTAMKIWPFDPISQRSGGRIINAADLREGIRPLEQIRDKVGDNIEVMIEGHGYWHLAPAIKIAHELEAFRPAWLEDLILAHRTSELRRLRESTSIPLSVSEFLMTRWEYLPVLEHQAADYVMIDPTWAGGITETKKIASMADTYGLPVTMHDCTGPFTMLAGMHLLANAPNGMYQEIVRAFIRYRYPDWVDWLPEISNGTIGLPDRPGIGATLAPDIADRDGYHRRVSTLDR